MKVFACILAWGALIAPLAACNNVVDCPSPSAITAGGSCSGDHLECPYTLDTPSPACDGTTVEGGLATSCVCQTGRWSCPSPVSCDAAAPDDAGGDETAGDASDGSAPHDANEAAAVADGSADSSRE